MDIKFNHCTALQKGEAYIYYMYNRQLEGFLIASMVAADNSKAKLNLAQLIQYFFNEISRKKDVYCSLFNDNLDAFKDRMEEHGELNGMTIYKIKPYKELP